MNAIRVAVLGAGGLGRAAARIIGLKRQMRLVAICDSKGFSYNARGLSCDEIKIEHSSMDSLGEIVKLKGKIDGVFVALPNLPNDFIYNVMRRFMRAGFSAVFIDAIKRTSAMAHLFALDGQIKKARAVYITGCGATPGLLSAAAVLAAQSFIKVAKVDIWWGVGISNWEAYRATIREDIAHLPGYTPERARRMTDREVDALLDKTDGKLTLRNMEHADDLLLQRVGVVDSRKRVSVGGVMDTRCARKPVSTTMTLTGKTFEGKRSSHKFILGDETSMAANVIGPALGYMKRGLWLRTHKIYGIFGSTEFMPMVVK